MNDLAIAARRAKTTLSADDYDALKPIVQAGTPAADAVAALVKTRVEAAPADPAAAFAARFGLPSDAERTFPPNKSGLPTKAPRADAKAQREGAVSSIPDRWLQGRTRALEQQGLSPRDAIQQAAQDWREQATASKNQYADIPAELAKPAKVEAKPVKEEMAGVSPEMDYAKITDQLRHSSREHYLIEEQTRFGFKPYARVPTQRDTMSWASNELREGQIVDVYKVMKNGDRFLAYTLERTSNNIRKVYP
jgi:hypothetical protein